MKKSLILFVFIFVFLLIGCGGGGGGGDVQNLPNSDTVLSSAPTNIKIYSADSEITLSWELVDGANQYNVYMASEAGITPDSYDSLVGGEAYLNQTSPFRIDSLTNDTAYYFVIVAQNSSGSISFSSREITTIPTPLNLSQEKVWVTAGSTHSMARKSDGSAWSWGSNIRGELGDVGGLTLNRSYYPLKIQSLDNIVSIAGGWSVSMALDTNGLAFEWGIGTGSSPTNVQVVSQIVKIRPAYSHALALENDGTVWSWGENDYGQLGNGTLIDSMTPIQVININNVTDIASNLQKSFAVRYDGTVWHWGRRGAAVVPEQQIPQIVDGVSDIIKIAVGYRHAVALKSDGTVWTWGFSYQHNFYGELGDGTIEDRYTPAQISGVNNVVDIAASCCHNLALKSDGTVWAWGANGYSALGSVDGGSSWPIQVSGISDVASLSTSSNSSHNLAIKNDGTVWAWGRNDMGQLGDGSEISRATPAQVIDSNGIGFQR